MQIDQKTAKQYRDLVANQGFDFAFRRFCRCELGWDASTIQGEQNQRAFESMFIRKTQLPMTMNTSHNSESILRGVPWG